ncbi:ribosome silencing factor [Bifidobacterium cuniculi]|uniref:Ribosomal silencing factor RsfS n=1 Tax=Bifidobacterium cuniculi TaxID=1688 RepID=A0A087AQD6_9BIFI|nr:ribosome silencing factor [Bifidobacterium cuniculi]KFI60986.1 iojap family protein [Bifidobacterium cuniculi]
MTALQQSIDETRIAAAAADRMKAEDIVAFDVSNQMAICDTMLVASASNERQVLAVAEEIEKDLALKAQVHPKSREGIAEAQWILLDYGDIIVHVMHEEARGFYNLERLWRDCPQVDLELPQEATQE